MPSTAFWEALDALVSACEMVIDRPCGTAHPRYSDFTYPLDEGYLQGPLSNDGSGIDLWRGTMPEKRRTAIIVNVDLQKRDSEIKLLIGCTAEEQQTMLRVHDQSSWGRSTIRALDYARATSDLTGVKARLSSSCASMLTWTGSA